MTEHQFAAGGVVIKKDGDEIKILLIKDGYGHWIWPKGHIEPGEEPENTALREISEETGQHKLRVLEELGKQEYYFTLKGKKIFKTVHVFLIRSDGSEDLDIQTSEIQTGEWLSPEDALKRIEYKESRNLLKKGIEIFRRKYAGE